MTRTTLTAIAALSALTLVSVLVPGYGHAAPKTGSILAQQPFQRILPVVDYNRDNVRDALRELMGNSSQSFTIDSDVQGEVTLSLHNVTFDTALQLVLRQVDATYRMEGSVIHVYRKAVAPATPPVLTGPDITAESSSSEGASGAGDTVIVHDGSFLYVLRGTRMFKLRKSDLKIVAAGTVPR
ncbi:hypothetical protein [Fimbriimonas ginsengisoli]|uniref:Secretin/TonB short N-terminal domain-containing protein n=1 Tax=Fimbriimonas ginsengisoli Gsoil 348 TaxID=661478 RepID=A0A068NR14_FIMGI|nr:hypothetical protein [Fimbriimonas ginsengisoli]AIE84019.1 hypothetical protein OP10G_0651 [Fimbriimonas ginsengisoli Gsoil 348]